MNQEYLFLRAKHRRRSHGRAAPTPRSDLPDEVVKKR